MEILALQTRQTQDLDEILNTVVTKVCQIFNNERVIIYQFNSDGSGTVVFESVAAPQWSIIGKKIENFCFQEEWVAIARQGKIQTFTDLETAELAACHKRFLGHLQAKSNLIAPILFNITE